MEYSSVFGFEVKDLDAMGEFVGYASVFGGPPDLQGDIVRSGAFTRTIKKSKGRVPILMGHNTGRIVGFGTHAEEDPTGLKVNGQFTIDSDEGRNAYATCRHASQCGHKLGLSIGYMIPDGGAERNSKTGVRTLTEIDLLEYSIAATPACTRASVIAVKSAPTWTKREFEEHLRDVGFSDTAAKRIIAAGFDALGGDQRDVDNAGKDATELVTELRTLAFQSQVKESLRQCLLLR